MVLSFILLKKSSVFSSSSDEVELLFKESLEFSDDSDFCVVKTKYCEDEAEEKQWKKGKIIN